MRLSEALSHKRLIDKGDENRTIFIVAGVFGAGAGVEGFHAEQRVEVFEHRGRGVAGRTFFHVL